MMEKTSIKLKAESNCLIILHHHTQAVQAKNKRKKVFLQIKV
jgi:hypothetical protein